MVSDAEHKREPRDPPPVRMLLVEDDPEVARTRVGVFEHLGCEVTPVQSAEDAMQRLSSVPYDIVLTDINLGSDPSDMSGLEIARLTREMHPNIPIVGYSAMFSERELPIEEHPEVGLWFVKGNLSIDDLETSMRSVVELARQARDASTD